MPFGLGGDAVARDAGLVMNNGNALAGDAIKQGGLADIWTADNGKNTWHSYFGSINFSQNDSVRELKS